ncbi:MAG: response regulator transcription factor [Clostridiales bacterium]|jgi:two-component system alkaline phosphatase synthesis response regulator PhoP|nr:response regulator transcription factor [Clostridiales bacterium]
MALKKIYVVEDDADILEIVLYALTSAGFEAQGFENGDAFGEALRKNGAPALVMLDVMLPGDSGLIILKGLRAAPATRRLPVIMLTAKTSEIDRVKGLDMGADDYIPKPFGVMELVSRVNAVLRRGEAPVSEPAKLACGRLTLDDARREVLAGDEKVTGLTFKEYELLRYMMINAGLVLNRDKMMDAVWGSDFVGESRTLDMHIRSLRQKLGAAGALIKTVRNVGYTLGND